MNITDIFVAIGYVIAGGVATFGLLNRTSRQQRIEDSQVAQNLIANLKTTVEEQNKQIASLMSLEKQQSKDLANLQGQLSMLKEIFEGRDPAMQSLLKSAPELMRIAEENNALAKNTNAAITGLATSMSEFLQKILPHVNGASIKP